MTTATCQPLKRALFSLPILETSPDANPGGTITGPHSLAAVKMLRISVTDVCNLRCQYCMPEEGIEWLAKSQLLTFEEIASIVRTATDLGITHFKLTGGEPTARRDLPTLVKMLADIPGVRDLSLTTNGVLLGPLLPKLKAAGLDRLTISLDSLVAERFSAITRGGDFQKVWTAIQQALAMNFSRIKINVVVMRNMNEEEIPDFAGLTKIYPLTIRFIEFMPLGRSQLTDKPETSIITESQIRERIESVHGPLLAVERSSETGVGPAKVFALRNSPGRIGFISAMSQPFCDSCNRLRLTPDGLLRSCLFDGGEIDLKPILRNPSLQGATLMDAFNTCVELKPRTHSSHGNKAMSRIGG